MRNENATQAGAEVPPITPLCKFCRANGISNVTAWRWRKAGFLETVTIAGRPYVTGDGVRLFLARAKRGELARLTPEAA